MIPHECTRGMLPRRRAPGLITYLVGVCMNAMIAPASAPFFLVLRSFRESGCRSTVQGSASPAQAPLRRICVVHAY